MSGSALHQSPKGSPVMKRACIFILSITLLLCSHSAIAAKARSISSEADSARHADHLRHHLGKADCHATGNYIKTRSQPNGNKTVGHLEQADSFILLELENGWAQIEVTHSDKTSPDSWDGMTGWVNPDYIDCSCSPEKYFQPNDTAFSNDLWDGYNSVLLYFYHAIIDQWDFQRIVDEYYGDPHYFPASLQNDGFILRDLNSDGTNELIILSRGYFSGNGEPPITAVYTLKDGFPLCILNSWARSSNYLCYDGSIYNQGSNGASYAVNYILDLIGTEFIVREGVLSGDCEESMDICWFLVDERADFSYDNHVRISEQEADARVSDYLGSIDYRSDGFISFEQYANSLK